MNVARLRSPVYALCLSILAVTASCGTADVPPKKGASSDTGAGGDTSNTTTGGGSATAGTMSTTGAGGSGTGSGGSTGAGGSPTTGGAGGGAAGTDVMGMGGMGGMAVVLEPASPLPVTVDGLFAPSGFMGDGAMPNTITLANGMTDCPMRAPGNIGNCSKFTYTPIASMATGGMGWAGVYWQYPANNWGTLQGKHIEAGATKVTFYAAGAKGGEVVSFLAGGISGASFQDPLKAQLSNQVLTTAMTQYTIDLTGSTYVSIIGGFGWTIEAKPGVASDAGATFDTTPITFYVDGIQWVK